MRLMSDIVKFYCENCGKFFDVAFDEVADLQETKCKYCKSDNIFIREFKYEIEPDRTLPTFGSRGCGTSGRFK